MNSSQQHPAPVYIGPHRLSGPVVLAPMTSITDLPFRRLCLDTGASLAVSEMTTADTRLWTTEKSRRRLQLIEDKGIPAVQIAGSEPRAMAGAARAAAARGAKIIDINMGCPAKKVCKKLAGSALLKDLDLVKRILDAVVGATDATVTLKIRTGWDRENRNGVTVAQLAEQSGIQALAVHGRTRACAFRGAAEYETIRRIKAAVKIPVFANGDINSPEVAARVMKYTGADGVLIGRAARGNPWLLQQVNNRLTKKIDAPLHSVSAQRDMILDHLIAMYSFYGEHTGVRVARKHLGWYLSTLANGHEEYNDVRNAAMRAENSASQMQIVKNFFRCHLFGGNSTASKRRLWGDSHRWRHTKEKNIPGKSPASAVRKLLP